MRGIFAFIITAAFFAPSGWAQSGAQGCLDASDVSEILQEMSFFSGRNARIDFSQIDLCNLNDARTKTMAAAIFLKKHSQMPSISSPLDQNILGVDSWEFFKSLVDKIYVFNDGDDLCDGTKLAYTWLGGRNHEMYVCDTIAFMPVFDSATTLLHEARHVQGYGHVSCHHGPFARRGKVCDESFQQKGSYAVEVEYDVRLSARSDIDPILSSTARWAAISYLYKSFEKVPFDLKRSVLLQEDSGQLHSLREEEFLSVDGGNKNQVLMAVGNYSNALFDLTTQIPLAVDLGKAWRIDRLFDLLGATNGFMKNKNGISNQSILDAIQTVNYYCFLYERSMKCANDKSGYVEITFSHFAPISFVYSSNSTLIKNKVPHIAAKDGGLYELPVEWDDLLVTKDSEYQVSSQQLGYKKVITVPDKEQSEYVLSRDGQLMITSDGIKNLKLVPGLETYRFRSLAPTIHPNDELNNL